MKSLVVYSSQSGNTKKLAEAVFEALPEGKEITPVDGAPDPKGYDFVAVGFWLKGGDPDPKSLEYLKKNFLDRPLAFYIIEIKRNGKSNEEIYNDMAEIFTRINKAGVRLGNLEMFLSFFAA